jgi:hypothetical protein
MLLPSTRRRGYAAPGTIGAAGREIRDIWMENEGRLMQRIIQRWFGRGSARETPEARVNDAGERAEAS